MSNEKPKKLKDFPVLVPPENVNIIQSMQNALNKKTKK